VKRILLYPWWLRSWHWINAILFVVLIWTGVELHFARPGTAGLGFQASRVIHNTAGILLTFNYLVFLLGNLLTKNGRYYLLNLGDITEGMLRQLRFYVWGIFRGEPHPFPHSAKRKFNPLQKISYTIVMYMILPLMVIGGWLMFFPDKIPEEIIGVPGRLFYALTHTFLGWLLGLFMMVHIYLGTTGNTPTELYKGILTGWVPAHGESSEE
jgi:thiosulfate reductase cytochrome b subunit